MKAKTRNNGDSIKYLVQAISGGSIESTLQKNGRFLRCGTDASEKRWASFVSPLFMEPGVEENTAHVPITGPPEVYCQGMRELQWILFKDVGKRLQAFNNLRTLVQALSDAIDGT
jgi:hypothetical protein